MKQKDRAELSRLTRLCREDTWRSFGGNYHRAMKESPNNQPRHILKKRAKARKLSGQGTVARQRQRTGTAQRRGVLQELSTKVTPAVFYGLREDTLANLGYHTYDEYLNSEAWAAIRRRVLGIDFWTCRMCGSRATEVHHTSYKKTVMLGADITHLHSLCWECHDKVEFVDGNTDGQRRTPSEMVATLIKAVKERQAVKREANQLIRDGDLADSSSRVGLSSLATRPQEIKRVGE